MSEAKKARLTPLRIFLGTILLVVLVAAVYDVATRKGPRVVDVDAVVEVALEDMDLEELQTRFDSIKPASTELRPSTMLGVDQRVKVAQVMISKSGSAEELDSSRLCLIRALFAKYSLLRDNKYGFSEIQQQLESIIDQLVTGNSGGKTFEPLRVRYQLAVDQLMDRTQTPETLPQMQKTCDIVAKEFFDMETAIEIEQILTPLTMKPGLGPEVDEALGQVIRIFADHPDKKLQDWSTKLADDIVFRSLDLFEIYDGMGKGTPGTAVEFLARLDPLFQRDVSPQGYDRMVGFCHDFDARGEFEVTLEAYRRIETHLSQPGLKDENQKNIVACQNGVKRIGALGKVVTGSFTDVHGRAIDLDGERLKNNAMLVLAVSSYGEFDSMVSQTINIDQLRSLNIRFAVICVGMSRQKVREDFADFLDSDVFIVPDPELNSLLYSTCPTEKTPRMWALSRDHSLRSLLVISEKLPAIIEEMSF